MTIINYPMKTIQTLIFTFLCLSVVAQTSYKLDPFTAVSVGGNYETQLIKSSEPKIEITMLKGDLADVKYGVSNGKLKVETKGRNWTFFGGAKLKAKLKIYYTSLSSISASAGATVSSSEVISGNNMSISVSSGADLAISANASIAEIDVSSGSSSKININSSKLTVDASSGSSIDLKGKVSETANFSASSGSDIDAQELWVACADASVSSGASISVWPTDYLSASASSGGSVSYKGEPKKGVTKEKSSGGSVSRY